MADPPVTDPTGPDADGGGTAGGVPDDEVRLELPALEGYGRVARVAAAALALRANLGFSLVEDARLAMEAVTDRCLPLARDGHVEVRFRIGSGRLDVTVSDSGLTDAAAADELRAVLAPLVHDAVVDPTDGTITFGLRRRGQ